MSSYGISCQSTWDSLTCNPPQHTPIYSLHTPSWMRQRDNTLNIWISCIRVPPWKQSQWRKKFWLFTEKNNWLHFCFIFPAAVLATFYTKKTNQTNTFLAFLFSHRFLSWCCHCQRCLRMSLCLVLLELCLLNLPLWRRTESPVNHHHICSSPRAHQTVVSGFAILLT